MTLFETTHTSAKQTALALGVATFAVAGAKSDAVYSNWPHHRLKLSRFLLNGRYVL